MTVRVTVRVTVMRGRAGAIPAGFGATVGVRIVGVGVGVAGAVARTRAALRDDAQHPPRRHANADLREQEQRKQRSEHGMAHEGRDAIARKSRRVKAMHPIAVENRPVSYHHAMFTCNIDRRGRTLRLVLGAFLESIGILLGILWFLEWTPAWTLWPALGVWLSGIFVMIEALLGWCAVRAMGFRTPV